jgi:hypothetical protein
MPYSDEVATELGIQPPTDVLGRAGTQLVNAPSNIFNAFSRMWYNLGFKDEGSQPVELPTAPLAPARGFGEKAIDVAANLGEQIPLIMAGEGAVGALGKAAELPALLTRIAKPAAGFGVLGASESPTEGAVQGALGAGFGAAEVAPLPLKILLAGGIGAASAVENYQQTQDIKQAAAVGGAMSIVPFFMRNAKKAAAKGGVQTVDDLNHLLEGGATPRLEDVQTARPVPGTGGQADLTPLLQENITGARPIFGTDQAGMGGSELPAPNRPDLLTGPKAKIAEIADGKEAAMPITVNGTSYGSHAEALDALQNLTRPKVDAATVAEPTPIVEAKPSNRLTLKSVIHADDPVTIEKAAKKLGIEYHGQYEGTDYLTFKIPNDADHPAYGANLSLTNGASYKDLKNELQRVKDSFEVDRPKWEAEKVLKAGEKGTTPAPETKVATLQPATTETVASKAIQYKGRTFSGASHEEATAKLEKAYPRYRQESQPLQLNLVSPLTKVASSARKKLTNSIVVKCKTQWRKRVRLPNQLQVKVELTRFQRNTLPKQSSNPLLPLRKRRPGMQSHRLQVDSLLVR